jgi:hypothetical protein
LTALVLDAGALIAVDRDDRAMIALLRIAEQRRIDLRTNAVVVGQVWRDATGRQANLARFIKAVDVRSIAPHDGPRAGELLGRSGLSHVVDATVALLAQHGDRVVTSDPADLGALLAADLTAAEVIAC